jgi:hypothetical protein
VQLIRGGLLVGMAVRAFDVDLRHKQPLGRTATADARGQYRTEYMPSDFRRAAVDAADVIVRACISDGIIQSESPTQFNVAAEAQVDLVVGGAQYLDPPEYVRAVARLLPAP